MNIKDIQQLIKFVAKSGVSEVKIKSKGLPGFNSAELFWKALPTFIMVPLSSINSVCGLENSKASNNRSKSSPLDSITKKSKTSDGLAIRS